MKHTQKQRFVYQGKKEEAVKTTTEFCYHCGQLGHLFNRCPYHALTQAKTPEELQLVEQEIQKARLAVGGQGWRGAVNRIENKITPDNLQNNTQEESQKQDQLPSKGNITFEVEPNACFRCGKTGHTSKQCTFQDNRVCFTCGGIGHVQKQCPIQHSYKEEKKRSRNENQ
ncbi:MAG: hypothetical protein EZS28_001704 [Streblomastix strix]|uniref:CCHC-type domain-containing protein n=1 Tax=Streblomastix strix TaxID=222440 RepID=A0A5J4X8B7_9EUKA|nr:MAG: hypothetical protein EZS28_001704 [Streblomastix strix]